MNAVELITRKRDGLHLSADEIAWLVGEFAVGRLPDYQMAAWAMAVYFQGMSPEECAAMTLCMLESGRRLEHVADGRPLVDKHSTGGVGDKTSLILAPLVACCDVRVPMLSGRGLGPTGGTLDKLESLPGFRTDLSIAQMQQVVQSVGCVITGASAELAPADRKLYALRDVTGTVASVPLITASILSKKLAESLDALVLDVKFGSGAFMKSHSAATDLARSLTGTANIMGLPAIALLTDMNQPLGRMCGNAVEVLEAVQMLRGEDAPADLVEVTYALAVEMLLAVRPEADPAAVRASLEDHIVSGRAMERFERMVCAQGATAEFELPVAPATDVCSPRAGFVAAIDTQQLGLAIIDLGGGRRTATDTVDHSTGLEMLVRIGDAVDAGQPLVRVFSREPESARRRIERAVTIGDEPPTPRPLIAERISSEP